jgi:hypothetical protein
MNGIVQNKIMENGVDLMMMDTLNGIYHPIISLLKNHYHTTFKDFFKIKYNYTRENLEKFIIKILK